LQHAYSELIPLLFSSVLKPEELKQFPLVCLNQVFPIVAGTAHKEFTVWGREGEPTPKQSPNETQPTTDKPHTACLPKKSHEENKGLIL